MFLNAVAKYQIPTLPGLAVNPDVLPLLQAQDPTFSPVASQAVNQNQKENSQYTHLVWRHDVDAEQSFQLAGFLRNSYANFTTDPFNTLAYTPDQQTANQKRTAYSLGTRLDYTWTPNTQHLVKTGFQVQYTNAQNQFQLFDFRRESGHGSSDRTDAHAKRRQYQRADAPGVLDPRSMEPDRPVDLQPGCAV